MRRACPGAAAGPNGNALGARRRVRWHSYARWVELDPVAATLSYWDPAKRGGPPKKILRLEGLEAYEANPRWRNIWLTFKDRVGTWKSN